MEKEARLLLIIFVNLLVLSTFVSASFDIGNESYEIATNYGGGQDITGWINMSFDSELSTSLFSDSNGNEITLLNLLQTAANGGYEYSCSPSNCEEGYNFSEFATTKTFSLGAGESKLVGIKLSGSEVVGISSVSFNLESNAGPSCTSQLRLDLFNDDSIDYVNSKDTLNLCSLGNYYGCFDLEETSPDNKFLDDVNYYCQIFNFSEAPGFIVGAQLKNNSVTDDEEVIFELKKADGSFDTIVDAECSIPSLKIGTEWSEQSCYIDYPINSLTEYYVCVKTDASDPTYMIKSYETSSNACGFYYRDGGENLDKALGIFIRPRQFDSPGTLEVVNDLQGTGMRFNELAYEYITETYENDCFSGCVIPIKITSGVEQDFTLSNLEIVYDAGGPTLGNNFADLTSSPAMINADFGELYLNDGGFSTPTETGNYSFQLDFSEENIISENLRIDSVPIITSLFPLITYAAYPTTFNVAVSGNNSVMFNWDFGDNQTSSTTTNEVKHTYSNVGNYLLRVNVTDVLGKSSSKQFNISVQNPKDAVNMTIFNKKDDLDEIQTFLLTLSAFQSSVLKGKLNLTAEEEKLSSIEQRFSTASDDTIYIELMQELLELKIPNSISFSKNVDGSNLIMPGEENINLEALKGSSGTNESLTNTQDYLIYIRSWMFNFVEGTADYDVVDLEYDNGDEESLTFFDMRVTNNDLNEAILFVQSFDEIEFEGDSMMGPENGYYYKEFDSSANVNFYVSGVFDTTDVGFFVSPPLESMKISSDEFTGFDEGTSRLTIFILLIILLIILGVVGYALLQQWYKHKYEEYLFKDRNNLFNLVNFINGEKKNNVSNPEIRKKLKKAKWNGEQIDYVMKRYEGKKTGMPELFPIDKIMNLIINRGKIKSHLGKPGIKKVQPIKKIPPRVMPNKSLNSNKKSIFSSERFKKDKGV